PARPASRARRPARAPRSPSRQSRRTGPGRAPPASPPRGWRTRPRAPCPRPAGRRAGPGPAERPWPCPRSPSRVEQPVDRPLEPRPEFRQQARLPREVGIAIDRREGAGAGPLDEVEVVGQTRELEIRKARLLDVEQRPLTAQAQVLVGQLEPVRR